MDQYKAELRDMAQGDPRISFLGFVEGRAFEELLGNAALYVQPSEVEGLSVALLEAMSYGNCCLASDIPENLEAIGDAGACFRCRDMDHLLARMQELCAATEAARCLGEKARERIRTQFSWDVVAERFEILYERLLHRDIRTPVLLGRGPRALQNALRAPPAQASISSPNEEKVADVRRIG